MFFGLIEIFFTHKLAVKTNALVRFRFSINVAAIALSSAFTANV